MSIYLEFIDSLNSYSKGKLTDKQLSKLIKTFIREEDSTTLRKGSGYWRYWKFCQWFYFDFYCSIRGLFKIILGTRLIKDDLGRIFICTGNRFGYTSEIFRNKIKIWGK